MCVNTRRWRQGECELGIGTSIGCQWARSTDDVPVGEPRPTASQLHTRRGRSRHGRLILRYNATCAVSLASRLGGLERSLTPRSNGTGTERTVPCAHTWRLAAFKIAVTAARSCRVRLYASRSCIIPKPSLTSASRAHGSFVTGRNPRSPGGTYTHGVGSHGRA